MKKSIVVLSIAFGTLLTAAFAYSNWNTPCVITARSSCNNSAYLNTNYFGRLSPEPNFELFYDLSSRFAMTVTKEQLNKAESILDIAEGHLGRSVEFYYSVSVTQLDENYETIQKESGANEQLTPAQVELLRSVPYSADILIRADFKEKAQSNGKVIDNYATPHYTVVPEIEAQYSNGKEQFIKYVSDNTKDLSSVIRESELKAGRISFTVSPNGVVTDVHLNSSSGYPEYDSRVLELIANMPGTWTAASTSKGEKVAQKLVFFFGQMGC